MSNIITKKQVLCKLHNFEAFNRIGSLFQLRNDYYPVPEPIDIISIKSNNSKIILMYEYNSSLTRYITVWEDIDEIEVTYKLPS